LSRIPAALAPAYAHCERLARSHYENFPVASRLLPAAMRPHVAAVYAFARTADDIADEGDVPIAERYARLDAWLARLRALVLSGDAGVDGFTPVFQAVGHTIETCRLPVALFEDLVSAFRQDVETHRYETWAGVLDYCRRSANPVGRLVLGIAGVHDPAAAVASDAVCTALQLTNFWQDLAIDWGRGRLYLPAEIVRAAGADEADLGRGVVTAPWRAALGDAARRTRALFLEGRPVCDAVRGRLRYELRVTWLGGVTILDRCEGAGFDVFRSRPALRPRDLPGLVARALLWRT
jgi:phytoene synthase